jgi:serine/threonine protein kinase
MRATSTPDTEAVECARGGTGWRAGSKVIDFGIAKATDKWALENTLLTQVGQIVGTPEYASPEQASR